MLKIEFDRHTGHYMSQTESRNSKEVLADMACMVFACGYDLLGQCGKKYGRAYVDLVRKAMDALEEEFEEEVLQ